MKLGSNNTKTTINVRATEQLQTLAKKGKLWHGQGFFWLLASATSKNSHAFYFRHAETKKRSVLKDDNGVTLRPQSLVDLGGDYTLKQIEEIARVRSGGRAPVIRADAETLADVLERFVLTGTEGANKDVRRDVTLFANGWIQRPACDITAAGVEARLEEIALGRYVNPLWRELQAAKKSGDEEKIEAVKDACADLGIGIPQKEKCGTPKQAEKFARYLRMVLVNGKRPVFASGDDPVTAAKPVETILEVAGEDALDIEREALPMRKDEVAALFNYTRSECRQTKNGMSQDFDPFVWQSILACRLALLTGYRMKDIATLHDGNDKGDRLTKKKGECAKRPKATHTLPVSAQMRDIIDEARAMRDRDLDVLRKRFQWTKPDLLILNVVLDNAMHIGRARDAIRKRREAPTVIFPSLTNWSEQKQPSQIARPAFNRMKAKGDFRLRDRRTGPGEWLGEETLAKPHDMRSTFATYAFGAGVDLLVVSRFMNHAISKEQQAMTARYIGATSETSDKFAAEMQKTSDAILEAAKDARKDKLTVVK